jgi:hypothetical protein
MRARAALPRNRPDRRHPDRRAFGGLRRSRTQRPGRAACRQGIARLALAILLAAFACCAPAQPGELGVNVYGLSYHFERDKAKASGFDNEVNPGLGLRYRMPREDYDWIFDAGALRDSKRNTAVLVGAGALWKPTKRLRLGAALGVAQSDTYNEGDPFIAPLPLLAYEWRAVSLNLAYFPRVSGVNDFNTVLFWLAVWPRRE